MIKRVKNLKPSALLSQEIYRNYIEAFESETIRGISTLSVLEIIDRYGSTGTYGYQILKELKTQTNDSLVIEEGRLYPLLKKLEKWGPKGNEISLIYSKVIKKEGRRKRNYLFITEEGKLIKNYLKSIFLKIVGSISNLLDFEMIIHGNKNLICPNCDNLLTNLTNEDNYCEICGLNISDLKL